MRPFPRRTFLGRFGSAALAPSVVATIAPEAKTKGSPIKVGQIGVGHAHASKLAVYRRSPDYEVVGVVEPDEALRKQAETQRGLPGPAVADPRATPQHARAPGRAGRDAGARPARQRRGVRRRGEARPPRQAGRRVAAPIPTHPRAAAKQKLLGADGLHVPLQPGRRAAPRVPVDGLARRGLRGPRGDEQGRRARRAARAGGVSAAASCSSSAATSSTWSSASWASRRSVTPVPAARRDARRRTARTTCSRCSSTRGPPPR